MESLAADQRKKDFESLIGKKFNKLTVIDVQRSPRKKTRAFCKCDCGSDWDGAIHTIISGHTKSCGCYRQFVSTDENITHGLSDHYLYGRWQGLLNRCYNSNWGAFKNYGARGITVCDRWRIGEDGEHPFVLFLKDMLPVPFKGASIDRVNNDLGYGPDNCIWADRKQQAWNRRDTTWVHLPHSSIPLQAFCDTYKKSRFKIITRMKKLGISLTEAATLP